MTAPAPTLLPRTAAPDRAPSAAPAAAPSGPQASETAGFADILAREASPQDEAPGGQPSLLAALVQSPELQQAAAELPEIPAQPGKDLPEPRQRSAASPAALLALTATQALIATTDETAEPAAKPAADEPDTAVAAPTPTPAPAPALTLLPGAVLLPQTAPAAPAPTGKATTAAAAVPPRSTLQNATPRADEPSAPTARTAHAAAFAVTSLVLEREAAAPVPSAAQPLAAPEQSAPEAAAQNAARAQTSTLAALTGNSTGERPAARKLRSEADPALPAAKSAVLPLPETIGAPAQAQPSTAPAATVTATPDASGPQPISFDQLVDSIARARDGLVPGGPVGVAMHHAEFGRVSLRIEGDANGLSVALASPDPAFAPAVAAAHAAAVTAEPVRTAVAEPRTEPPGQGLGQNQGQGQGQSQSGNGQRQAFAAPRPATSPARPGEPPADRRSDIFA